MSGALSAKTAFSTAEEAKPAFSLARCRAILGSDGPESDRDLEQLRNQMYGLARVVVEACLCQPRQKGSPCALNAPSRVFDGSSGMALLPQEDRYDVEERAAIMEFDGGLARSAAELAALSEYWRVNHRRILQ
jgi:hypothetical protein